MLSLSSLSYLLSIFEHNPQGESIASESWSGYIVSKSNDPRLQVTGINASWIVPAIGYSLAAEYSSVWIGIGGQLDNTLIQAGTEQDVSGGQTKYYAWYELLPNYAVRITTLAPSPGDIMVASLRLVDPASNQWNIQISDSTTGQYFGTTVYYNSTRSSGEWIIERPTINSKLAMLADFGNVTFSGCHLNSNNSPEPINTYYFSIIDMTDSLDIPLTSVSRVADSGESFSVTYISQG